MTTTTTGILMEDDLPGEYFMQEEEEPSGELYTDVEEEEVSHGVYD